MRLLVHFLLIILLSFFVLKITKMVYAYDAPRLVRVGAYNNKPKIYKDNNDNAAGVFADIINYIAKKEGWDVEYVFGKWETGLDRLKNGNIDLMVDVADTPEREKEFDFTSVTVLHSYGVIYVQKNSSIKSPVDLKGKKISILKSSVYETGPNSIREYLKAFGVNPEIVEVEDYRLALDLLEIKKVDAAVVSYIFGLGNEKDYSNIEPTKIFLKPSELKFALTKDDPDNPYFINRLDYWVTRLKNGEDGYFKNSLEKNGLGKLLETEAENKQEEKTEGLVFNILKIVGITVVALSIPLMLLTVSKQNGKKITSIFRIGKRRKE